MAILFASYANINKLVIFAMKEDGINCCSDVYYHIHTCQPYLACLPWRRCCIQSAVLCTRTTCVYSRGSPACLCHSVNHPQHIQTLLMTIQVYLEGPLQISPLIDTEGEEQLLSEKLFIYMCTYVLHMCAIHSVLNRGTEQKFLSTCVQTMNYLLIIYVKSYETRL